MGQRKRARLCLAHRATHGTVACAIQRPNYCDRFARRWRRDRRSTRFLVVQSARPVRTLHCLSGLPPRLLLVVPNIVHVERELDVSPSDFRLWVCLHEETHRVQFTAVPWLGPWLREQITDYLNNVQLDAGQLVPRLKHLASAIVGALRGVDVVSILEETMTDDERALLHRLTGVMSLLEGHADVMMDEVGPEVLPTVSTLRDRMQRRRTNPSGRDAFVRRLLGMESKLAQYRDGANFVRSVIDDVGLAGFNTVWTSPETLPPRATSCTTRRAGSPASPPWRHDRTSACDRTRTQCSALMPGRPRTGGGSAGSCQWRSRFASPRGRPRIRGAEVDTARGGAHRRPSTARRVGADRTSPARRRRDGVSTGSGAHSRSRRNQQRRGERPRRAIRRPFVSR